MYDILVNNCPLIWLQASLFVDARYNVGIGQVGVGVGVTDAGVPVGVVVGVGVAPPGHEPIQVIKPMPTGLKLKPSFYYSELIANVSNTIKHIFNVVNSKSPIGFIGVMKNGTMLNDYSSIASGDKLILCYDFKTANGLFEVSLIVL